MNRDVIIELREKVKQLNLDHWLNNTLFHWEWWLLLVLSIIPWIVWWRIVDKKRTYEILLFGLIVSILNVFLDDFGTNMVWWDYPHELVGMMPPLLPVDIAIIPCAMMIIYQYFGHRKSYILVLFIFGVISTYVGEELFIKVEFFERITWKPYQSILLYLIAGVIGKWILTWTAPKNR